MAWNTREPIIANTRQIDDAIQNVAGGPSMRDSANNVADARPEPFWEDVPAVERALGWMPIGVVEENGREYVIQVTHEQELVACTPTGNLVEGVQLQQVDATQLPYDHLWQVSTDDGGTRIIVLTNDGGGAGGAGDAQLFRADSLTGAWTLSLDCDVQEVLEHCLCDCGNGKLFWVNYSTASVKIYHSNDGGETWPTGGNWPFEFSTLATGGPIEHMHGMVFDPRHNRILIMTGDAEDRQSILAGDVDEFIADVEAGNAATWLARWALRDEDTDNRAAQLAANPDYSVEIDGLRTTQLLRTTEILFADDDWACYGPDSHPGYWGGDLLPLVRFDRSTLVGESFGEVVGQPRQGKVLSNGVTVLTTIPHSAYPAMDMYARLYAVDPANERITEIRRWARSDLGQSYYTGWLNPLPVREAGGLVWLRWGGRRLYQLSYTTTPNLFRLGVNYPHVAQDAIDMDYGPWMVRHCTVGRVRTSPRATERKTTGSAKFSSPSLVGENLLTESFANAAPSDWTETNGTLTYDAGTECEYTASPGAFKLDPDGAGTDCKVVNAVAGAFKLQVCRGQFVTASGWIMLTDNSGTPPDPGANPQKAVVTLTGGSLSDVTLDDIPDAWWDGEWHFLRMTKFIDVVSTGTPTVSIYAHDGTLDAAHEPIWFDGWTMAVGCEPADISAGIGDEPPGSALAVADWHEDCDDIVDSDDIVAETDWDVVSVLGDSSLEQIAAAARRGTAGLRASASTTDPERPYVKRTTSVDYPAAGGSIFLAASMRIVSGPPAGEDMYGLCFGEPYSNGWTVLNILNDQTFDDDGTLRPRLGAYDDSINTDGEGYWPYPDEWFWVVLELQISEVGETNGEARLWIDNTLIGEVTGLDNTALAGTAGEVRVGITAGAVADRTGVVLDYDDVVIAGEYPGEPPLGVT